MCLGGVWSSKTLASDGFWCSFDVTGHFHSIHFWRSQNQLWPTTCAGHCFFCQTREAVKTTWPNALLAGRPFLLASRWQTSSSTSADPKFQPRPSIPWSSKACSCDSSAFPCRFETTVTCEAIVVLGVPGLADSVTLSWWDKEHQEAGASITLASRQVVSDAHLFLLQSTAFAYPVQRTSMPVHRYT